MESESKQHNKPNKPKKQRRPRRRLQPEPKYNLGIKLPYPLFERFDALAAARNHSLTQEVLEMMRSWLEHWEPQLGLPSPTHTTPPVTSPPAPADTAPE